MQWLYLHSADAVLLLLLLLLPLLLLLLQPPLWRYILASTMTGAFALLSYLAAWQPPSPSRAPRLPPQHLVSAVLYATSIGWIWFLSVFLCFN
jgi:hypothetical protein